MRNVVISLDWPHNSFALGWEYVEPDDEYNYHTYRIFLGMITIEIDFD